MKQRLKVLLLILLKNNSTQMIQRMNHYGHFFFLLLLTQPIFSRKSDLSILLSRLPETYAIHNCKSINCITLLSLTNEGLYTSDEKGLPLLQAESHQISSDQLIHTFKLKNTTYWCNGDPLTAQHYVNGFHRFSAPQNPSPLAPLAIQMKLKHALSIQEKKKTLQALGIKALDSETIEIRLESPNPILPHYLKSPLFSPLRKKQKEERYGLTPSYKDSNGAFCFSPNSSTHNLQLIRNPYYHLPPKFESKKLIEKIKIVAITEQSTQQANFFLTDQVDFLHVKNLETLKLIKTERKKRKGSVKAFPSSALHFFIYNLQKPYWRSKDFRCLISNLIDRASLVKTIEQPVTLLNYLIPDWVLGFQDVTFRKQFSLPTHLYTRRTAQSLKEKLQKENFPFPKAIHYFSSTEKSRLQVAHSIKEQLESQLPLKVKISTFDSSLFFTEIDQNPKLDIAEKGWMLDVPDALNVLALFQENSHGSFNSGHVNDKDYNQLAELTRRLSPVASQAVAFAAEQHLLSQCYALPFYQGFSYIVTDKNLKGIHVSPHNGLNYDLRYAFWEK